MIPLVLLISLASIYLLFESQKPRRAQDVSPITKIENNAEMEKFLTAPFRQKIHRPTELPAKESLSPDLAKILQSDDACSLSRIQYTEEQLSEAVFSQFGSWEEVQFFSIENYRKGRPSAGTAPPSLFYNALLYADLLESVHGKVEVNLPLANRLIEDLKKKEPNNGAYDYYQSLIFEKMEKPLLDQRLALGRAIHAPYFDTKIQSSVEHFLNSEVRNPTLWLASISIFSSVVIPQPVSLQLIEKKMSFTNTRERQELADFGKRLHASEKTFLIEKVVGAKIFSAYDLRSRKIDPKKLYGFLKDTEMRNALQDKNCRRDLLDVSFEIERERGFPFH